MPRIKRSRERRIGGGARCSRRHAPRSSKRFISESRARVPATSTAALSMLAIARRFDAIAAEAIIAFQGGDRKTELLFHRARQKPAHAVLLPADGLRHLFDARSFGPAQQREHALPLGHA